MKYAITLTKTIVIHVEADTEADARFSALDGEAGDQAIADGDWHRAEPQIQSIEPQQ